jgi:hypothetical protein
MPLSLSLLGGYDCDYRASTGRSTVHGSLTIRRGSLVLDGITID